MRAQDSIIGALVRSGPAAIDTPKCPREIHIISCQSQFRKGAAPRRCQALADDPSRFDGFLNIIRWWKILQPPLIAFSCRIPIPPLPVLRPSYPALAKRTYLRTSSRRDQHQLGARGSKSRAKRTAVRRQADGSFTRALRLLAYVPMVSEKKPYPVAACLRHRAPSHFCFVGDPA